MVRVTANIRLRAPSPFGAPSRYFSASGCACEHLQQLALLQTPSSELLAPRSLCRRGRVRSRPGAVCETARGHRNSLHQSVRHRLTPLMSDLESPLPASWKQSQARRVGRVVAIDFMWLFLRPAARLFLDLCLTDTLRIFSCESLL